MTGRPSQGEPLLVARGSATPTAGDLSGGCLFLVDKPSGPSSFAMVSLLRRLSGVKRIGHAGTLDPFASGLLILLSGQACRWQEMVMGSDKRYRARLRLGRESDSHDRTGHVVETGAGRLPGRETVEALLPAFTGEIDQVPPMHSAVKVQGMRLYKLARRGQTVERTPRRVTIHSLALADWQPPCLDLDLWCGKGTYVRSLARDLGRALGCGALVQELRRTWIGGYDVERALDPEALRLLLADAVAREAGHAD